MPGGGAAATNGQSFKLAPHTKIQKPEKPLLVVVLDGWGEAEDDEYNAISRADTPCMDSLKKGKPDRWMLLKAHGTAVSLVSRIQCSSCVLYCLHQACQHLLHSPQSNLGHGYQSQSRYAFCQVGLPSDDDMGNSEVGHNALGSGQVVSSVPSTTRAQIQASQAMLSLPQNS